METIVNNLFRLKKEPSKIAKVNLLKEFLKEENFRIVVELALDETMHYNISKLLSNKPKKFTNFETEFSNLVSFLTFLSEKQGATQKEKAWLTEFAFDKNWEHVIKCIITKDLKCGVGAKLVNQAVEDTVTIFPYMRCSTSSKKDSIEYPAYVQVKENGLFVNIVYNKNKMTFLSRNGNEFIFPEQSFETEIKKYFPSTLKTNVYMGEFRVQIDGKWLPRKTSNGIVNKALKKNQTISTGESIRIHFICWDVIPLKDFWEGKCDIPYKERFKKLSFLSGIKNARVHLSKTWIINSFSEAQNIALELIENGEEGSIIKNFKAIWKNTTSTEQIKLKAGDLGIDNEQECELKVIDWYYGKPDSKYKNCLGGLICISSDDELETRIGSGFSDEDRGFLGWDSTTPKVVKNFEDWMNEKYKNKIVTIRFNEVIKAKTSKKHALFSARFIEIREDKKIADSLQYIKDL